MLFAKLRMRGPQHDGIPEDIADAALWLAGPAFVTGLNLQVNGGMFLSRFPTPAELPGGAVAYQRRPG